MSLRETRAGDKIFPAGKPGRRFFPMTKKEPQKPEKLNLELSQALGGAMFAQTVRQKAQRRAELRAEEEKRKSPRPGSGR